MIRLPSLLLTLLILGAQSTIRYYIYDTYYDVDDYSCYKQKLKVPVIVPLETGLSAIDSEEIDNIKNAKAAGLVVEVLLSSCRTRSV